MVHVLSGFAVTFFFFGTLQLRQQQQVAEGASRQDAARIGAMNAKLTKDYNRVKAIAEELSTQVRCWTYIHVYPYISLYTYPR